MANELSLDNVGGIFVVLLAGMGIACSIAVIEYIWKSRRLENQHPPLPQSGTDLWDKAELGFFITTYKDFYKNNKTRRVFSSPSLLFVT